MPRADGGDLFGRGLRARLLEATLTDPVPSRRAIRGAFSTSISSSSVTTPSSFADLAPPEAPLDHERLLLLGRAYHFIRAAARTSTAAASATAAAAATAASRPIRLLRQAQAEGAIRAVE